MTEACGNCAFGYPYHFTYQKETPTNPIRKFFCGSKWETTTDTMIYCKRFPRHEDKEVNGWCGEWMDDEWPRPILKRLVVWDYFTTAKAIEVGNTIP